MNILAIGAHPDDIEMLCAGTLARYAAAGHSITMAVATNGNVGSPTLSRDEIAAVRREEQDRSCARLGAELVWMDFDDEWLFNDRPTRERFLDAYRAADPDIVFCHSISDYHPDHRIAGQVAIDCRIPASVRLVETSLPACSKIPLVLCMDTVGGIDFTPEVYVDITETIDVKRSMLECHESQDTWLRAIYDMSYVESMERQASMRGYAIGTRFAEAFTVVRTYPFPWDGPGLPGLDG